MAVPSFEGRISPVFDWAQRLVVVDHNGKSGSPRGEVDLSGVLPPFRAGRLAELGVQTLLCGGISAPVAEMVEAEGIRVIPGLAGKVDAVLQAFLAGRLPDPAFAMPGWRWCGKGARSRRRRRRRQRRSGGRGQGMPGMRGAAQ